MELRVQWLEAKGNLLSRLDAVIGRECFRPLLVQALAIPATHERTYRNRPLSDAQKASNRQKSRIRARIEHIFGYLSQSMKGFYLRYIGRRRNAATIGLINLIYNLDRYEQIVRLKLLPLPAV